MKRTVLAIAVAAAFASTLAVADVAPKAPDLFHISDGGPVTVVQAPAASSTVDTGTYAGQALVWVITVFGGTIGTVLTGVLIRVLQKAGVDLTEAQRDKLQGIIVNGLNLGAAKAATDLQGKGQVEIKNAAVASAVAYAQAHGAETLKSLGLDPTSPEAVEAIKARIETAIADDNTPTHPALDAPIAAAPAPT